MKLSRLLFAFILFHLLVSANAQDQVVTLEEVISLALEKNYDVLVSRNLAYSAATDDKFAPGAYLPVITPTEYAPGTEAIQNRHLQTTPWLSGMA
jgi:hypothetical protein